MKKAIIVLMFLASSMTFCACNGTETAQNNESSTPIASETEVATDEIKSEVSDNEAVEVVELTIPSTFVGERSTEELREDEKADGFISAKMNDDHSMTFKISKADYEKYVQRIKDSIKSTFDLASETYDSVVKAELNDDLTKVTLTVNQEGFDNFNLFSMYMNLTYYHVICGTEEADVNVKFDLIDENNSEVFATYNYPADM